MSAVTVMQKEVKLLFKSKRRILLLFMMPLMIIIITSLVGFSAKTAIDNTEPTVVYVINDSASPITDELIQLWQTINDTEFETPAGNFNELMASQNFEVVVWLPANFTSLILNNQTAVWTVAYNANDTRNSFVATTIVQLTELYEQQLIRIQNPQINFNMIQPNIEVVEDETPGGLKELIIVPIYFIFFIVISPISLVLISVTLEREQRTLEVLFLQPVKRSSIMMGKILYGLVLVGANLVLDVLAILVSIGIFNKIVDTGNDDEFVVLIRSFTDSITLDATIMFFGHVTVIAVNIITMAVLLSLLAKDEKEANMIAGFLPLFLFSGVGIAFSNIEHLDPSIQTLFTAFPVMGSIVAIYLAIVAGEVILIAYISLIFQIFWIVVVIWVTAKISEAESILELTFSKAMGELWRVIRSPFFKNNNSK